MDEKLDPYKNQVSAVINEAALYDEVDVAISIFANMLKKSFSFLFSLFLDFFFPLILSIFFSILAESFSDLESQNPNNILTFFYLLICLSDYMALF